MGFLKSTPARILTAVLIIHALLFYGNARVETPPSHRPLSEFPKAIGDWRMIQEGVVEQQVQEVLLADDTLSRSYGSVTRGVVNLFVAYFASQRTGANPHSPKHCLPGSGWAPTASDIIPITISGRAEPIRVNRYIIAKGDQKSAVLYWYQSRDRVIASEYAAKIYLVADAIRYNRTDTALVRILVPVRRDQEQAAVDAAVQFANDCFGTLRQFLPN